MLTVRQKRRIKAERGSTGSSFEREKKGLKDRGWRRFHEKRAAGDRARKAQRRARKEQRR